MKTKEQIKERIKKLKKDSIILATANADYWKGYKEALEQVLEEYN